MADFSALKQSIQNYIKLNGNKEITGAILQNILLSMVTTMGDGAINDNASDISDIKGDIQNINGDISDINGDISDINGSITDINGDITDLNGDLSDEINRAEGAESTLQQAIIAEKNRAEGAETTTILFSDGKLVFKNAAGTVLYQLSVDSFLSAITTRLNTGALYAGYATPSTTPAALTSQEVFYVATQAGTYTNFHFNGGDDPIVLTKDGIYFIVSGTDDDDWNAEPMLQLDDVPTASSNNAVKSGGVAEELALGAVYDVSAKNPTAGPNSDGKWESLSALLSDANLNTLIPTSVRKGGMSIKFICSSDKKYVQYFLTKDEWSADTNDWEKTNLEEEIKDVSEKTVHNPDNIFSNLWQTEWENTIEELYINPYYIGLGEVVVLNVSSDRSFCVWHDSVGSNWKCENDITTRQDGEIIPIVCIQSSMPGLSVGDIIGYVIFSDITTFLNNTSVRDNGLNLYYVTSILTNPKINYLLSAQKAPSLFPNNSISGEKLQDDSVSIDKLENTIILEPKNLLNPNLLVISKWINADGGTDNVSDIYGYYDYIAITGEQAYHISNKYGLPLSDRGDCYIAFYDSNKNFISSISSYTTDFTTPQNASYVRISVVLYMKDEEMLEVGTTRTDYEPYFPPKKVIDPDIIKVPQNSVGQAELQDDSVTIDKLADTIIVYPKNILNPAFLHDSAWINSGGGTTNVSSSYGYYDYISVAPNTAYHLSGRNNNYLIDRDDCYIAFYDNNKDFISSITAYRKDFITPANTAFVRISVRIDMLTDAMLEIGSARTDYEPYFAPKKVIDPDIIKVPTGGVGTDELQDDAVTIDKLASNVSFAPAFKGFVAENNAMSVNTMLTTDLVYICKNTLFVAQINGTIESIKCGIGYEAGNEGSVEITATKLNTKIGGTVVEHNHGLVLGERTVLSITRNIETVAVIRLFDDYGNSYVLNVDWETVVGRPFLLNNNSSATISAKINFMPRDITKDIWLFGDSYFSYNDARWLSYMIQWGFVDWLANARPGEDAVEALADLNVLLSTGKRPRYVVWCMGMNHGRDVDDAVNPTWLQYTNAFLTLCNNYNITPILSTTPSVPTEIHTKMNEYVRASGYRYIDFAEAVENGTNYYWKGWGTANQLLSNDEVHPSVKGAITLANQVLSDFPEISIDE